MPKISSWGGRSRTVVDDLNGLALPVGAMRSYGDACLGPKVQRYREQVRPIFDGSTVTVDAATRLEDLILLMGQRGLFPPVVPGTAEVTIGGMLSADVHGKNHESAGTFGSHVSAFSLASVAYHDIVRDVLPDRAMDADLFRATIGGMGLMGRIASVRFEAMTIETPWILQKVRSFQRIDDLLGGFSEIDEPYSVAWIASRGGTAEGPAARLMTGRHALRCEVPEALRRRTIADLRPMAVTVPPMPVNVLGGPVMELHDRARLVASRDGVSLVDLWSFFFPLDRLRKWNRLLGPRGFYQVQFVLPDTSDGRRVLREILGRAEGRATLLVLKKLGDITGGGWLSFPRAGWTAAIDLPAGDAALAQWMTTAACEAGGRIYLAKDAMMTPDQFREGYRDVAKLEALRRRLGLKGHYLSDMMKRLGVE